jgi:hypothetical protein
MDKDFFETEKQVSKYNDAAFSISRLNDSWNLCKIYIRRGNFKAWKIELDNIFLELYPDLLKQDNNKELEKENDELMANIANSKNKRELFFNLMKRHSFLRKLQDLAGKAGVYVGEYDELAE